MEANPIGIIILIVVALVANYANKKMASSDNANIRRLQKISDVWIKFQFVMGIIFALFVLFIFSKVGK
jgi:hypothetical protein|uniref:Uncharacterized protein n=1 Tax=viral metagenome TaxID=1070528 RepID=A0A6C0C0G7_9ZZZZ